MSTLLYGLSDEETPEQTEAMTRITDEAVRSDDGGAQMDHDPDWNERSSDDSVELTGPARRDIAGAYHPSRRTAPALYGNSQHDYNAPINAQVASSGSAARREEAGQAGAGSMPWEVSIEPLNPAEEFGQRVFVRQGDEINGLSRAMMTPTDVDHWDSAVSQSRATEASREAIASSLYDAAFGG